MNGTPSVLTTNNQNKIDSRNLRANDPVQLDMTRMFAEYGYRYERKPREYDSVEGVDPAKVVPNDLVGQSTLAMVLRKPSDARRRRYKVWGELYQQIFSGGAVEPHVLAYEVYRHASRWVRTARLTVAADDIRRKLANNAVFHLARMAAQMWLGSGWEKDMPKMKASIAQLQNDEDVLSPHFAAALELVKE